MLIRCDAVQPCKKSHMSWSGDEQEKSNMSECYKTVNTAGKSG